MEHDTYSQRSRHNRFHCSLDCKHSGRFVSMGPANNEHFHRNCLLCHMIELYNGNRHRDTLCEIKEVTTFRVFTKP
jgi:hypothetical protein